MTKDFTAIAGVSEVIAAILMALILKENKITLWKTYGILWSSDEANLHLSDTVNKFLLL